MQNPGIDMLTFEGKQIYLACGATDMRKSINGLMGMVQNSFQLNPFENNIYIFCNRNRNRLKILEWDGDGFWLYFKRLERGHFRWPRMQGQAGAEDSNCTGTNDSPTMTLDEKDLAILLGSARVELKFQRREVKERNIS